MSTVQPRFAEIALAILLLFTVGSIYGWPIQQPKADAKVSKESKITTLLRERLAALKEIAAQAAKARENGTKSYVEVHEANEAVLRAELDLADTREERIAICEKLVTEAKKHEEHVATLAKTGQTQSFIQLKARIHRLEAEIDLERERAVTGQVKQKK